MYIIKIYLVIDPGSIHRASEALGTSCVVGVSFVTGNEPFKPYLSFCYWSNSGWDQLATPKRLSSPLEGWNFTTPLSLRWREGLEIEFDHMTSDLINHAYEMNETPCINSGHWSFWVGECAGSMTSEVLGEGMEALNPPSSPRYLFCACLPLGCFWVTSFIIKL